MRIAHVSDIHIRNYRYHDVYKQVFQNLFEDLKQKEPDYIFVTGDVAHTKTNLSPEYFSMAYSFFGGLSDIADTYVFVGNHDMNLRNMSRSDAISPVVEAHNSDSLKFFKNSVYEDLEEDIRLHHLSIVDGDWKDEWISDDKVNVAAFHGIVNGVEASNGYVLKKGDISTDVLKKYDYALLGDIHKPNQSLDDEGRIRYAGSLIQQNYAEEIKKGYLLWDIEDKDNFECDLVEIENPVPFYTFTNETLEDLTEVPENARVRLKLKKSLDKEQRAAVDKIKAHKSLSGFTIQHVNSGKQENVSIFSEDSDNDIQSIEFQENALDRFFSNLDDDKLERMYEINREVEKGINKDDSIARNTNWTIDRFEWSNLFNYGEDNYIEFSNLKGNIGIFGKNWTGKSSIIEALLYTIFNKTSKDITRKDRIINRDEEKGWGKVQISKGDETYYIERTSEKYERTNGEIAAKTNAKFYKEGDEEEDGFVSLEGTNRWETEDNIRSVFGTIEDFQLTSLTSQFDSLHYISEGSTKRKDILARFLGLEIFDKKEEYVKDEISSMRSEYKNAKNADYAQKLKDAEEQKEECSNKVKEKEKECEVVTNKLEKEQERLREVEQKINDIPTEEIDYDSLKKSIDEVTGSIQSNENKLQNIEEDIESYKEIIEDNKEIKNSIDLSDISSSIERYEEIEEQCKKAQKSVEKYESKLEEIKEYKGYIEDAPCNSEYSDCKLVEDAYDKLDQLGKVKEELEESRTEKDDKEESLEDVEIDKARDLKQKYDDAKEKVDKYEMLLSKKRVKKSKTENKLSELRNRKEKLEEKEERYHEVKEAIEQLKQLKDKKRKLNGHVSDLKGEVDDCKQEIQQLYKKQGYYENRIEELQKQWDDAKEKIEYYENLKKYRKSMHSNGIPYEIIKDNLKIINRELTNVLSSFENFEVKFKNEEDKLNIYIENHDRKERSIEMGSGGEKMIAAMAIRLALLEITTIPKSDIFILDEPATELDPDKMELFIDIIEIVKERFGCVILISHLETLKDVVDEEINISKKSGKASVQK